MANPRTPEQMSKDAWQALDEFTESGKITLPDGSVIVPDAKDPTAKILVDTFKWLAMFQGKPKKTPRAMDDWKPAETK